jgi:hypothetical protein
METEGDGVGEGEKTGVGVEFTWNFGFQQIEVLAVTSVCTEVISQGAPI